MKDILKRFDQQLQRRQRELNSRNLYRNMPPIDFASNDYLGLSRSKALSELIHQATLSHPASLHGATGSRLISGNSPLAEDVEEELAAYFQAEGCLLYNSGYAANQGLLSALLHRGDTVIYDELAHACIKDGCRLSPANRFSFRHNNIDHLRQKLARAEGHIFVVVESVYSMDGDEAPLADMVALCQEYNAGLIVDEAHSTGLWGPNGAGSCVEQGIASEVLARVYTFGKALGVHGACVAGSQQLMRYLINFSRTFIYTTALPAHTLFSIREALRYRIENPELAEQLFRNIDLFHQLLREKGDFLSSRLLPSRSPVQAVLIPGNARAIEVALNLHDKDLLVWPILSPTVSEGEERLRICLHAFNSEQEIIHLVDELYEQLA